MELTVIWTKTSVKSLKSIEKYIRLHFTKKEFDKLLDNINETISIIKKGNVKHKFIEKTNSYKAVVLKKSSIYYKIKEDKLIITAIWDNRMMRGKSKYE
jgi:mRNA-degrading endonuclease RelE of RelBE toxin-antitoxin system